MNRRRGARRVFDVLAAFDVHHDLQDRRRTSRRTSDDTGEGVSSSGARYTANSDTAHPDRPVVLVVDDVDGTRAGIAELLDLRGYRALQASDGADGIRVLREHPDVRAIVLDLQMPRFDGFWFREEQLRDPTVAAVPVIVFTATAVTTQVTEQLGVTEVLVKPFSVDQLFESVERQCGTSQRR